ncbi:MAG: hypothetical protein IKA31_02820 [Clostridia bacterium]|nr:hypothetical protein [Clostridia bacterium]
MLACKDYNKLLNRKQKVADKIARTQRQKDLKVDTINKKYESQIDKLMREQSEINILVSNTQEYVARNK